MKRAIGGTGFVILFYVGLLFSPVFWVLLVIYLVSGLYELKNIYTKVDIKMQAILYSIAYLLFIISLGYMRFVNVPFLIYVTALLMYNDVFAFVVGVQWGKHKLSKLSPNKTIEGSIGGMLISPFVAVATLAFVGLIFGNTSLVIGAFKASDILNYNPFGSIWILIAISPLLAILGQVGDLLESYFKRSSGIKDSGKIVYGHGGILDRIDSWIIPIILIAIVEVFI